MKRLHVHVSVVSIPDAIGFYSGLFATEPTVRRPTTQSGCWTIRA